MVLRMVLLLSRLVLYIDFKPSLRFKLTNWRVTPRKNILKAILINIYKRPEIEKNKTEDLITQSFNNTLTHLPHSIFTDPVKYSISQLFTYSLTHSPR